MLILLLSLVFTRQKKIRLKFDTKESFCITILFINFPILTSKISQGKCPANFQIKYETKSYLTLNVVIIYYDTLTRIQVKG